MQLYFRNMKYLSIVVIATRQFIFFLYIFCKNNGKNISFNPGLTAIFLILKTFSVVRTYMSNLILKHVLKYLRN